MGRSVVQGIVLGLLLVGTAAAAPLEPGDPWLSEHAYYGKDGCLAAPRDRPLKPGDPLLLFDAGKPVRRGRVTFPIDADSSRRAFDSIGYEAIKQDSALWRRIGCFWGLRGDDVPTLVHYEATDSLPLEGLSLALEAPPPGARVVGGNGSVLNVREMGGLLRRLGTSIPAGFTSRRILRAGSRYSSGQDEMIELYLGRAVYGPKSAGSPIDSIAIARMFIHNGQVLATQHFTRVSGIEERVELGPPELDETNWHRSTQSTCGFFSLDDGTSWNRISVDVGPEGIGWEITGLREGFPRIWESFLTTPH